MLTNIAIGCCLVVITTFLHAAAMVTAFRGLRIMRATSRFRPSSLHIKRGSIVAAMVLIMFLASLIEAGVWGATYVFLGAMADFEHALYFSMVTYTTLGFGDVVMPSEWRLLSSFEAANGIIMFGWTTALIVATVQRVYSSSPELGVALKEPSLTSRQAEDQGHV